MSDIYLNIREAAEFLGIRPYTLREWSNAGRISHFRVGKAFKFRVDDLNDFMAKGFKPSGTPIQEAKPGD